ncbi:MAG: hypothetical protein ACE5HQ_08375 [Gemmatimonadota bacterium]
MDLKKLLVAAVVVGVVVNVFDYVVHGLILAGTYEGLAVIRQDASLGMLVFGDFVAALVLVWVYARVYDSFGGGTAAGARFGFYAGVLISFPTFIFDNLLLVDFPYSLSWTWTVTGILWGVVAGTTAGAMYKKGSAAVV